MVNEPLNTRQFLPPHAVFFAARKRQHTQAIQKIESDQPLSEGVVLARASQWLCRNFTIDPLGSPVDE
jgi:hypothetical protein